MNANEVRTDARERALGLLYEGEVKGVTAASLLDEQLLRPDEYVCTIAEGVAEHSDRIDELISGASVGWTLDRMAAIDRAVLRVATYELLDQPDVPTGVVLSEAVAMAKKFSTDRSTRFVNGILAALAKTLRPTDQ